MSRPLPIASKPSARVVRRLHAVFPEECVRYGIASIPLELCDAVQRDPELSARFEVASWVTTARGPLVRAHQRFGAHPLLARFAYKWSRGAQMLRRRTVRSLIAACAPGDLVLLYPGLTPDDTDELRAKGAILVHEPVNTAHPAGWHALQRAYAAAGIAMNFGPDLGAIAEERRRLHRDDYAFVTSPLVRASHEALGLRPERLIPASYGYPPSFRPVRRPADKLRFLFVARGSVRKGLPVLLAAWARAKLDARLSLVGGIEPEVASHCERYLRDASVEVQPYTQDLAAHYSDADVFVLPSFEEGSPLVSYMALATGLPSVLSPAASGWVVRDGVEGLVVEPDDVDGVAAALRRLADDAALRERLGAAALQRASEYTWDKAAARRLDGLDEALRIAR